MAEEGGSVSEPEMGNKHGAGKKHSDNNNIGEFGDSSDADYKYVSIIDVNPPSPQYHSALEESLCQTIEVNTPVKVNGNVSPIDMNEEVPQVNKDGDVSLTQNEEILNCSVIIVDPNENGHSVSRISVNGEFESYPDAFDKSKQEINRIPLCDFNLSPSFVDLIHKRTNSLTDSSISNVSPLREDYFTSTSTPCPTPVASEALAELNKSFVLQNGSFSFLEDPNNRSAISEEEVERVFREKLKRQRSGSSDYWNHDDNEDHCIVDFLDKINDHAEARLAAKRQARAEAREIRMRELERLQRETDDNDRVYDIYSTPDGVNRSVRAGSVTTPRSLLSSNNSYHSSRRSSEDSLEEVNSIRDVRMELKECEEKFRKAMVANAQLDNEKAALAFQVDILKDKFEELEEQHLQLTREHKDTCRQLEQTKRHRTKLQEDLDVSHSQLAELLQLIQEKGLVVVEGEEEEVEDGEDGETRVKPPKKALVSAEVADVLQQGSGSLDVRLKRFVEERNELMDELRRVKLELEEERALRGRHANGPTDDQDDIQREANKLLGDYKFKLQKAEQDVNTLQATVARLESQVVRYKSAAETSEKLEDELKVEKRKLQRELREAQARVEELETSHSHLQKRLDKLKNAKSALFKDL